MAEPFGRDSLDLYDVLGLHRPGQGEVLAPQAVRAAFRRSLLLHHPDKSRSSPQWQDSLQKPLNAPRASNKYSVDEICYAREVLSSPILRRTYDREYAKHKLAGQSSSHGDNRTLGSYRQTLEEMDLDDLSYDEAQNSWSRVCRCGNREAFKITEEDLEDVSAAGSSSIIAGCEGCSLHIKVVFAAVDDGG